jgi:twitching motility protein PilT
MLTLEQKTRLTDKRDLDLGYQVENYRYRVNFAYEREHLAIVARIVSENVPTLEEIGMPPVGKK